jgi:hypothetical protein
MANKPDEPLTLTVHNMPSFDANSAEVAAKTRRGRWTMLFLLLVCTAPVIASYFTYYVIRPEGKRNYGELIDPQRPIPALMVTDANGVQQPLTQWKDQWLLISVADGACDATCQQHLYWQRQLRETLGKEKDRLDWVWLRTGNTLPNPETQAATAKAEVLAVDAAALAQWLQPAPGQRLEDHLYLVDPIGNWMMRFPAQPDLKQVKRDIDRLMRASSFWDKAGRVPEAVNGVVK